MLQIMFDLILFDARRSAHRLWPKPWKSSQTFKIISSWTASYGQEKTLASLILQPWSIQIHIATLFHQLLARPIFASRSWVPVFGHRTSRFRASKSPCPSLILYVEMAAIAGRMVASQVRNSNGRDEQQVGCCSAILLHIRAYIL